MIRSRLGLRTVGLCLVAALSLMAFAAASAQAEKGSAWMVNGTNVNDTLLPELEVKEIEKLKGTEERHAVLLFTTKGGTKVEFLCTEAKLVNAKLELEGKISLGKVVFHKCITKLNGVESKNCEPQSGASKGLIETKNGTGLIILHLLVAGGAVEPLVLITPDVGTLLATVEMGELCAIGSEVPIEGKLTLKDCLGKFATELTEHLVEEGPLTELKALGTTAKLDGSAIIILKGASHVGLKWSGLPSATKP